MVDFSKPMDNYFKEKGIENPTAEQRKEVAEDLAGIIDLFRHNEDGSMRANQKETIFSFDENTEISVDDFGEDVLSYALGDDGYDIDDFDTLLKILDQDNNGMLNAQELALLSKDGETLSRKSMWSALYGDDSLFTMGTESKTGSTDGTGGTDSTGGTGGLADDDDGAVNPEVPVEEDVALSSETPTEETFATYEVDSADINKIRDFIYDTIIMAPSDSSIYRSPEDLLSEWESAGEFPGDLSSIPLTPELMAELRSSYMTFNNDEESIISQKMQGSGISRSEAIEILQQENKIGTPNTTSSTEVQVLPEGTLTEEQVEQYVKLLQGAEDSYYGTIDYDKVNEVLFGENSNLTDADIVKIVNAMSDENSSYLWEIQEYCMPKEKAEALLNNILPIVGQEALAGNQEAIEVLCEALETDTKGSYEPLFGYNHMLLEKMFGTNGYEKIFGDDTNAILKLIKDNYPTYADGRSLIDDIKGEWKVSGDDKFSYENILTQLQ